MKKRGFTLIELLVVIAIIGLLSSIVFASLGEARAKARDARRKADLAQIQTALELFNDSHGGYPNDTVSNYEELCNTNPGDITVLVTEGFLPSIPCDPKNSGDYKYRFDPESSSGIPSAPAGYLNSYCLYATLEGGGYFGKIGGASGGCPGT